MSAFLALGLVPLAGGGSRRLVVGINERDKAYKIRAKLARRSEP